MFPGAEFLTNGRAPPGVWLLSGPPTSGKTNYLLTFLSEHLQELRTCLYLVTDQPPTAQTSILSSMLDVTSDRLDDLKIIDCYSWRVGQTDAAAGWACNGLNLSDISITIENARQNLRNYVFALDSITTLSLEAGPSSAYKFLQILTARLRKDAVSSIFTLEEDVHPLNFVSMLKPLFDGVFELQFADKDRMNRRFRIASLNAEHTCKWVPLSKILAGTPDYAEPLPKMVVIRKN